MSLICGSTRSGELLVNIAVTLRGLVVVQLESTLHGLSRGRMVGLCAANLVWVCLSLVKQMADAGVAAATDFDWASQMRFYWRGDDETGHLKVRPQISNTVLAWGRRASSKSMLGAGRLVEVAKLLAVVSRPNIWFSLKNGAKGKTGMRSVGFVYRSQRRIACLTTHA